MTKKLKRMTRAMVMSFMPDARCSFKSCPEIADFTTTFDSISLLPIETNAILRICYHHRDVILQDFENAKFNKIPFIDGKNKKVTCQVCGYTWSPDLFNRALLRYGKLPKQCRNCHKRSWQAKQPA